MKTLLLLCSFLLFGPDKPDRQVILVVVGAAGTEEYGQQFQRWTERWQDAAHSAQATFVLEGTGEPSETSDRERLREQIEQFTVKSKEPLWIVLIGHGTFDGHSAKFNLRGPDVSANELNGWLSKCQRPLAIINCASSSGVFVNRLSAEGRVVVTATKSGQEQNLTRFGEFLSQAIGDPKADLDKDEQTSLLEAFISASGGVADFYAREGRLATEHSLLDDNGDGRGTPAGWFHGVRAIKSPKKGTVDGRLANQFFLIRSEQELSLPVELREERNRLLKEIEAVRSQKKTLSEDAFYEELERILLQLSRVYETAERAVAE